ncbi:NACHT domain-containing protein [Rhodococcus sp. no. 34]
MPRYELNRLGSSEFEGLVQALIKEVIGNGSITFGVGPDGGREATFSGKAPYPSDTENWDGTWIFQAKYHDTELLGTSKCRKELVSDLKSELNKVVNEQQREVDNYIIATNVPLSPAPKSGTLDKLHSVAEEYEASIKNFAVWGADEINKFLDKYPGVRTSYFHLIVAGDLIASLLDERARRKTEVEITIKAYLQGMLRREQNAQLDQAGDVAEHAVKLQQVFFDLHACPNFHNERENEDQSKSFKSVIEYIRSTPQTRTPDGGTRIPVVQMFLGASHLRVVLVGGPGEGKSTVGQYLAQLHRAKLIGDIEKVAISEEYIPSFPRIPFRVILRDFAQWLSESGESGLHKIDGTLDRFICDQVQRVTSRTLAPEVLHDVLKKNPTLLILDGLDEVTDPGLKKEVLERADDFINRADSILDADLQVLATTRPTGYNDQFDPDTYTHLTLVDLEPDQIRGYVTRWIKARDLDDSRASRLDRGIEDCLNDRQIKVLMNTPLQVTILVLIISAGRTPPTTAGSVI